MKYIIFDVDGVLADSSGREQKYLIGKEKEEVNWDLFYKDADKDKPILSGILTARALFYHGKYELIFLTGRNESVKEKTLDWLSYNLMLDKSVINLIMRPDENNDNNSKFKETIGKKLGFENIVLAFDDNKKTVDMWRSHGVKCFHTDERNFKQNNY